MMSIGGKIRFLLLILGICCMLTAWSLDQSITRINLLIHEANDLQENLTAKEKVVHDFLSNPEKLEGLQACITDANKALHFINSYRNAGINLIIYDQQIPVFWSSLRVFPPIEKVKEGTSFSQLSNGWYEMVKRTEGKFVFLFLITVKTQYSIENQYLKNQIVPELFARGSLDLASFTDRDTRDIFSINKEYLFPVKLLDSYQGGVYSSIQLILWVIGVLCICFFIDSFSNWLIAKGRAFWGLALLSVFFLTGRLLDMHFFWMSHHFNLEIFNPAIYAQSDYLPSLGDFLLNVIALTWVFQFAFKHRREWRFPSWLIRQRWAGAVYHLLALLILAGAGFLIDDIFFGLVDNSRINFDITNIINLSFISFVCIFILCLVWLNVYLLILLFLEVGKQFNIQLRDKFLIFLSAVGVYFVYKLMTDFTVFFLVYALLIFILGWNIFMQQRRLSIRIYTSLFFCMAFLTAIKYVKFIDIKERGIRKSIAQKLLLTDDPKVISSINSFENRIAGDSLLIAYYKNTSINNTYQIHNYISKKYLDGYLSRFEYKMFEYNNQDSSLKYPQSIPLSRYKSLVRYGAIKTADANYFYRINDTFGFQNYFGIIPIFDNRDFLGSLVIELKSQPYDYNNYFPELLIEGKLKSDEELSAYSVAFYKDNQLYNQSGRFTYEMENTHFKGITDTVVFYNDPQNDYSHAIYQESPNKMIVISKEKTPYTVRMATLSFFFLLYIFFSTLVYGLVWFVKNVTGHESGWFNINKYLMINANKILYKTRIQLSIVLAVVATLLIVGWVTFFYITQEYSGQQEDDIKEKVRKVQLAYERKIAATGLLNDDQGAYEFNQFADVNGTFLNLYDVNGNLYLTSLRKMYDYGIIGHKMGPIAYTQMRKLKKSEFLNVSERIGTFTYAAAYTPIRNAQNQTIAYLGMPYYANEADYQEKIGLFINTLINIYALVFVLIGILAVFLANQITNPLTYIQESFKRTKLGEKNHPLVWHRHDEIGSMIKEYNKMLAALEVSATRLARSERESAWREMAKQVAHEIKNPLTPLKLGVQLLEKSWKEKDPHFERKFESFNKSFIEQIDSLAAIASEFSNFAKMPETKLQQLELIPFIEQAISVFNSTDHVEITLINQINEQLKVLGDKDQLLRMFNNLLKNAIEAMDYKHGGRIRIRVLSDTKYIFVEIQDNGKGIDESLQTKIFVPNFTTKSSGTGLGLAFVKQAIENAGGSIHFQSIPKEGTTFFLSFPIC